MGLAGTLWDSMLFIAYAINNIENIIEFISSLIHQGYCAANTHKWYADFDNKHSSATYNFQQIQYDPEKFLAKPLKQEIIYLFSLLCKDFFSDVLLYVSHPMLKNVVIELLIS